MLTKHTLDTIFFKNKNISKKIKLRQKNTTDKTLTYTSETGH